MPQGDILLRHVFLCVYAYFFSNIIKNIGNMLFLLDF